MGLKCSCCKSYETSGAPHPFENDVEFVTFIKSVSFEEDVSLVLYVDLVMRKMVARRMVIYYGGFDNDEYIDISFNSILDWSIQILMQMCWCGAILHCTAHGLGN